MQMSPAIFIDFFNDFAGAQFRVVHQRDGGSFRERSAGADGSDLIIGLDHVAVTTDDEGVRYVGHEEQGFQMPKHPVRAPLLGEFHDRARQISIVLLQFRLEACEQGKSIGSGSGETRHDLAVIQPAQLLGR